MSRKKKRNKANMQKPYKRTNPLTKKHNIYPWQEAMLDKYKKYANDEKKVFLGSSSNTNNYVIGKKDIDNWKNSMSYVGTAKLLLDKGLFTHYFDDEDDLDKKSLTSSNINAISSAFGLSPNQIKYINNKLNAGHYDGYLDIEIEPEYEGLRRVWDPNAALILERGNLYEEIDAYLYPSNLAIQIIGSIDGENNLNMIIGTVRDLLSSRDYHVLDNKRIMNSITIPFFKNYNSLVRKLALLLDKEGMLEYHRTNNLRLSKNPSSSLLKKYAQVIGRLELSLNSEDIFEYNDIKSNLHKLFIDNNLKHCEIYERLFGVILAARNICVIQKDPENFSAMLDFDFMYYMSVYSTSYMNSNTVYAENSKHHHSLIKEDPSVFFNDLISEFIPKFKGMIYSLNGISITDLSILNYKEWVIDVIRYMKQLNEYINENKDISTIFEPIPIRIILNFCFHGDQLNKSLSANDWRNIEFMEGLMPSDITDYQVSINNNQTEYYKDLLWDGIAEINTVRSLQFREELAPQLWDCAYYSSVLEPQLLDSAYYSSTMDFKSNEKNVFKSNTSNITVNHRRRVISIYTGNFEGVIYSGQRKYSAKLSIVRKEHVGDLDRLGWYVGFLKVTD